MFASSLGPQAKPLMRLPGRATALVAAALVGCAKPVAVPPSPEAIDQPRLHVVIDSGSSGTRICAFEVQRSVRGDCASAAKQAVCVRQAGGLAAATAALEPAAAREVARDQLAAIWPRFAQAVPALAHHNWSAAALGTGGYRDPHTGALDERPAWKAVWSSAADFLTEKGARSVWAGAISGAQEGELAWRGTGHAQRSFRHFAVLEIGGATAQHVWPDDKPQGGADALQAESLGNGMNAVHARLQGHADVTACINPSNRSAQNADRCTALVRNAGLAIWPSGPSTPPTDLFVLGASWSGTFHAYPWTGLSNGSGGNVGSSAQTSLRLADLKNLARRVCPLSDREVLDWAPQEFHALNGTGMGCFALSVQVATLEQLGYGADTRVRFGGDDRWAAGAAASPEFFPACSTRGE